jgi:hypothetical protein
VVLFVPTVTVRGVVGIVAASVVLVPVGETTVIVADVAVEILILVGRTTGTFTSVAFKWSLLYI